MAEQQTEPDTTEKTVTAEQAAKDAQLRKLQRLVRKKRDTPFGYIRHVRKRAYLNALAETGMHKKAVELAGVSRATPYTRQWKDDPEYAEALEIATELGYDALEAEAQRRAVEGVRKPVGWYKGKAGGHVQEFSDNLLMFLLKAGRPEKYAERSFTRNTTLHVNLTIVSDLIASRTLPQREIRAIREGADVESTILGWVSDLRSKGETVPVGLLGPGTD